MPNPTKISQIDADQYIRHFENWVVGTNENRFLAFNTNQSLYNAMKNQMDSPAREQTGLRVYYALNQAVEEGNPNAQEHMKFIVIPVDAEGKRLQNNDNQYWQADTDNITWRPCPPYCDLG